jgi:drug/metabolite transporter (DMT)-like permease
VEISVYAGIVYLCIFTTLVTFFLAQLSIAKIGATKVSAYNFLTPVFVIILSIILGMVRLQNLPDEETQERV